MVRMEMMATRDLRENRDLKEHKDQLVIKERSVNLVILALRVPKDQLEPTEKRVCTLLVFIMSYE